MSNLININLKLIIVSMFCFNQTSIMLITSFPKLNIPISIQSSKSYSYLILLWYSFIYIHIWYSLIYIHIYGILSIVYNHKGEWKDYGGNKRNYQYSLFFYFVFFQY